MNCLIKIKVPKPRKDRSVRFLPGQGRHKGLKQQTRFAQMRAIKKLQGVSQRCDIRFFEKHPVIQPIV